MRLTASRRLPYGEIEECCPNELIDICEFFVGRLGSCMSSSGDSFEQR